MKTLERYGDRFVDRYYNFPQGKFMTLFILRKTESEVIFRTEGSGEGLSKEYVYAGLEDREIIPRAVISKRKQTAVERRTGRELLRSFGLLFYANGAREGKEEDLCALNTNKPCGICADCMIYGYAVGGGGAQKSRVITDDAFSILPFSKVTDRRTFNAPYDNGTMRHPITGEPSHSIQEDEYIKPETIFMDIETLKDLTIEEAIYVIGNVLRSRRYGAISSRLGKMRNEIVSISFSDCEMFSNLELTQKVYDILKGCDGELTFPLDEERVKSAMREAIAALSDEVVGDVTFMSDDEVETLIGEVKEIYRSHDFLGGMLERITGLYSTSS